MTTSMIKSMNYTQLSKEAERLISKGWYRNFDLLKIIYSEMKIKHLMTNLRIGSNTK